MTMSPRRRLLILCASAVGAAMLVWWPAFKSLRRSGFGDWQFFHHMWEAGYVALTRHGEWPLWDPYHCGGITIFGNPQSQHLSPLYFLSLLVEPVPASKLFLLLHAAAGFGAMFVFARRELSYRFVPSLLTSAVWGGSGFFACHGSGGHSALIPFYLTPLVLLAWRKAADDPRYCAAVASLMTLVLLEGGVYPFPYLVLILAFDAAVRLADPVRRRGVITAGFVSGLLTVVMGAIRVLPIIDELKRNPRNVPSEDAVTLAEVVEMLTARKHGWHYGTQEFVWPEYGTFVGWGVVLLGAVGIVAAWRGGRRFLVVGLLVFGGLMLGDWGPFSPWPLLHELPIYDALRVPSRFAVFLTFFLAALSGAGLGELTRLLESFRLRPTLDRVRRALPVVLLLGVILDLLIVNGRTTDRWKNTPIENHPPAARYHLTDKHHYLGWYASFPRLNLGSTYCYEAMSFSVAKGLWTGDVAQARIADRAGEVLAWGRTTTTAWAEVNLSRPGTVIFNQNHAPGWSSTVGQARADTSGRLAVDVPAGLHRIELGYMPPTLMRGVVGSLVGLLAALLTAWFLTVGRVMRLRRRLLSSVGFGAAASSGPAGGVEGDSR